MVLEVGLGRSKPYPIPGKRAILKVAQPGRGVAASADGGRGGVDWRGPRTRQLAGPEEASIGGGRGRVNWKAGVAPARSPDVRFGPPGLRSLRGNCASPSWLRWFPRPSHGQGRPRPGLAFSGRGGCGRIEAHSAWHGYRLTRGGRLVACPARPRFAADEQKPHSARHGYRLTRGGRLVACPSRPRFAADEQKPHSALHGYRLTRGGRLVACPSRPRFAADE
jgi:hypothetical protein